MCGQLSTSLIPAGACVQSLEPELARFQCVFSCIYEDDAALVDFSVMIARWHGGVMGLAGVLAFLELVSWRWCYATARCLGSCSCTVIVGSGVGGCVNLPCTCSLKMMLRYGTLSWKLLHALRLRLEDDATPRHVILEVALCNYRHSVAEDLGKLIEFPWSKNQTCSLFPP